MSRKLIYIEAMYTTFYNCLLNPFFGFVELHHWDFSNLNTDRIPPLFDLTSDALLYGLLDENK